MKEYRVGAYGSVFYDQGSAHCVVLLPGFGYLFDRPLLHEAKELALQRHYNVLQLSFGELPYDKQDMKGSIDRCVALACKRSESTFAQLPAHELHFIAKSFGTLIACLLRRQFSNHPAFLLTPLKQTFPWIQEGDRIAYGDGDPFLDHQDLETLATLNCQRKIFCPQANHSLCHTDERITQRYLLEVKEEMQRFLDEFSLEKEYNKKSDER